MRRLRPYLLSLLSAGAAFGAVWWWRSSATRFALAAVEAARSPAGLPPEMVDDEMVERLRRVELARRLSIDTADRDKLIAALRGDAGPDQRYPPAERPMRQRERAARGLRAALSGRCRASRWPDGAASWIARVTGPGLSPLPAEVVSEQRALRLRLADAEGVHVVCEQGDVGIVIVRDAAGHRLLADIFPTHAKQIGISPFDPAMK